MKLRVCLNSLIYSIAIFVIIIAVVIGVTRLALSSLYLLHDSIEATASEFLQQPIEIGWIGGDWQGLYPELILHDIRLTDPAVENAFLVKELRLSIDWPSSVSKQTLQLNGLTIVGMDVFVEYDVNKEIRIHGIIPQQSSFDVLDAVFSVPVINLQNTNIRWQDSDLEQIDLREADLLIYNQDDSHQLRLSLKPNEALASSVYLLMDLTGNIKNSDSWLGNIYLEVEDLKPFSLLGLSNMEDSLVVAKKLSAWGSIQAGRLMRVVGQGLNDEGSVTGLFQWLDQGEQWQIDINGFGAQGTPSDGDSSSNSTAYKEEQGLSLLLDVSDGSEKKHRIGMSGIDVSWLVRLLLASEQVSPVLTEWIQGVLPEGRIDTLQIDWVNDDVNQDIQSLFVDARINDFSIQAWQDIPSIDGLDVRLKGNMLAGVISIESDCATFDAPNLFRWPLALDQVAGDLTWSHQNENLLLQTTKFVVANTHLQTESYLTLNIPLKEGSPHLDMQVYFSEGDISHVEPYLPAKIMPLGAVKWLDSALIDGRVVQGGMLFYGDLSDFPFTHNQGHFEVRFDIEESLLDYKEGWESIHALQAEVIFLNQSMKIYADKGKIFDVDLFDVEVSIEDLGDARLVVIGQANGSFSQMMKFVKESPAGGSYASGIGDFDGTGNNHLTLRLEIPLDDDTGETLVDGVVSLTGNRLLLPAWDLSLDALNGSFSFDGSALYARDIKARLWDDRVKINMQAKHQAQDVFTQIDISGKIDLLKRLPPDFDLVSSYIKGVSDWRLSLKIPTSTQKKGEPTAVNLSSALQGMSIDLPFPLTKNMNDSRLLNLSTELSVSGESKLIRVSYDDVVSGIVELSDKNAASWWTRIAVNLSKESASLSATHELMFTGRLDYLNVNDWMMLLAKGKGTFDRDARSFFADVYLLDLRLSEYRFNDTQVMVDSINDWDVILKGDDLSGVIRIPDLIDNEHPISVDLQRLVLNASATKADQSLTSNLQPDDVPAIDVNIEKLYMKNLLLGKLQVSLRPQAQDLVIDKLNLSANLLNIESRGRWSMSNDIDKTKLSVMMHDSSLENILHLFSIEDYVEDGNVDAELSLSWNDAPYNFSLEIMDGDIDIKVGKGRLLNIDTGTGKILGLLNFNAIPKRFTLDFDDFLQEGFAFDKMQGRFTLWNGHAYTNNFTVDSSIAGIQVFGRTGLYDKDYDLNVIVSPHVTSSLPLLGALAAGPGVGAVLYLADKLFSSPFEKLNKLADSEYIVSGGWAKPKVVKLENKKE